MKAKVKLPDGTFVYRKVTIVPMGNFQMMYVRYMNKNYLIGDGDEYLRGTPEHFDLGKEIN